MNFKNALSLVLCLLLAFSCLTFSSAEDEEIFLVDLLGDDMVISSSDGDEVMIDGSSAGFSDPLWNFPLDFDQMNPDLIVLANKHMLLPKDFVPPDLVIVKSRRADKNGNNTNGGVKKFNSTETKLEKECAEALVEMSEAAISDGIYFYLKSAYRSYATQNTMYYNKMKKNNGHDDGLMAMPGASDHQTGLGCDLLSKKYESSMVSAFSNTPEAQWMLQHCAEYGFILRYPADKEDITEIRFEPWHFRYVGVDVAEYIMDNGLCLEEFHQQLSDAIDDYLEKGGDPEKVKPYMQVSAEN